jgi:hypothetical protein
VLTRVAYRGGQRNYLWGFECPPSSNLRRDLVVKEHFKLLLEPEVWNGVFGAEPEEAPGDIIDVQRWFQDFLTALYKHIVSYFKTFFTPEKWAKGRVQYVFSIPTTWQQKTVIDKFEDIVKEAGFGSIKGQTVTIGLSEAEAAAIYTATYPKDHEIVSELDVNGRKAKKGIIAYEVSHSMKKYPPFLSYLTSAIQKGDVLLVCDAGGGTTVSHLCDLRSFDHHLTIFSSRTSVSLK